MRITIILVTVFLIVSALSYSQSVEEINLAGICAFKPGDDETWRSKYIDERESWNFIHAPGAWERQGYPKLDGYAWYRFRFKIPQSMKDDSLVLIIDGIDDVDETFLNGWFIGKTGSFPPNPKSEIKTVRIYPLPRRMREEFNLIAIRVYDISDSGGIDGTTIKIVRERDRDQALKALPKEVYHPPSLFLSNGSCLASFNASINSIESFYPHLYHELEPGLTTENTLQKLTLAYKIDGKRKLLDSSKSLLTEYYQQTNIVHQLFEKEIELFWYIPDGIEEKICVILLQHPKDLDVENIEISLTLLRPAFAYREIKKQIAGSERHYFILSYNSCCLELAERDLNSFLNRYKKELYQSEDIEREMMHWGKVRASLRVPPKLNEAESDLFKQAVSFLLMAQVSDVGGGTGQIISAFQPEKKKICSPFEHLFSTSALATAGLMNDAKAGFDFCLHTQSGSYVFYNVYGDEYGLGIPYLISPSKYLGNGTEFYPVKKEDIVLSIAGSCEYLIAFNNYIFQVKRNSAREGKIVIDSSLIAKDWKIISRNMADVIMERIDSTNLVFKDSGPLGNTLSNAHNIGTSIYAAAALRIASRFAGSMRDTIRMVGYKTQSEIILSTLNTSLKTIAAKSSADELSPLEQTFFDPLLIEMINLGLISPKSFSAQTVLDIVDRAFKIKDQNNSYLAMPNGDWFERQERLYLDLLTASAYAKTGNADRAEELFARCVEVAARNFGMIPELLDPSSSNWYGGMPSIGLGAAAFIQTAMVMSEMRMTLNKLNSNSK